MATAYVLNKFGRYEEKDGERGIHLYHGGLGFWLPYGKVTAIPNWTFREVDHDKSTPSGGATGQLVYTNAIVNGQWIAEEICNKGVPIPARDMGIQVISGKPTGRTLLIPAGMTAEGEPLTTEVVEKEATPKEIETANAAAEAFKRQIIANYFDSKRQRMSGGAGRLHPAAIERTFMEELNVQDIDDVGAHQKQVGGIDIELIKVFVEAMRDATEVNAQTLKEAISTVRKGGKAQLAKAHASPLPGLANPQGEVVPKPKPEITPEKAAQLKEWGKAMAERRKAKKEEREKELTGA